MTEKNNLDFFKVIVEESTDPRSKFNYIITADFTYKRVKDLVVKGGEFTAFWNGQRWSMLQDDLIETIDHELWRVYHIYSEKHPDARIKINLLNNESSGLMNRFQNYCKKQMSSDAQFNKHILFADYEPVRDDYSTYQLPYTPMQGPTTSFYELMNILYEPDELDKIMWCLGALFTGDIVSIEKFLFLYGPAGTGKGTVLKIINQLVGEYAGVVDLKTLTGSSEFSTADIKEVPLLMDTDTDISKIQNEQNLLRLTSHEPVLVRKLYKQGYPVTFNGLLVTASNERYKVKNKDSGINRRAIVVHPSGNKVPLHKYKDLMFNIGFEIPYIAQECINVYQELGMEYYQDEVDTAMIEWGDKVFSFVREHADILEKGITLKRAVEMYKSYLQDIDFSTTGARDKIKTDLPKYFDEFLNDTTDNGVRVRDFFRGFKYSVAFPEHNKRKPVSHTKEPQILSLEVTEPNMLDVELKDYPAQYASAKGTPVKPWAEVQTTLKDLDPRKLHWVKMPKNHIVIDFDITDEDGNKNFEANLKAASVYPETYMETSKSGGGIHLHYYYDGDVDMLSRRISKDIELKVYDGEASLRRQFIASNGKEIARIGSGLPLKEVQVYGDVENIIWTEKKLRKFVESCLNKEHHGATAPEVNFIHDVLNQAAETGVLYDLSDMRNKVRLFAMQSTNQSDKCLKLYINTPFSTMDKKEDPPYYSSKIIDDKDITFFDIEVFKNVTIIAYKDNGVEIPQGLLDRMSSVKYQPKNAEQVVSFLSDIYKTLDQKWLELHKEKFGIIYNPTPTQAEWLLKKNLVGFNNRDYDNHILYGIMMGDDTFKTYLRSQNIIGKVNEAKMAAAYGVSYADVYSFMTIKKSLKKWQIDLGIHHDELEFAWDEPLEIQHWLRAGSYCMNDVNSTDKLFNSDVGQENWIGHKIFCELTDLPPNTKTQKLAEKFLFDDDPEPQKQFNWYDLSTEFPGYTFEQFRKPQSLYLDEEPSEGGYVYSEPGIYKNVLYVDIKSMHPHSAIAMNYFGKYTPRYEAVVKSRLAVKSKDPLKALEPFEKLDPERAKRLKPYFEDEAKFKGLAFVMKIIVNIVYGMSSAKWPNKFKDPRNIDNCIAKRGALFMIQAKQGLQARGVKVVHVKTDSMKLVNYTQEDVDWLFDLARQYKYEFDTECVYEKMALVNKAVLIGKTTEEFGGEWEAVGAEFAQPYVFKTLFTDEYITREDLPILKSVQMSIFIGDEFIGKNAEIYASKTGKEVLSTRLVDIAPMVRSRYEKEKYLLVREKQGKTPEEQDAYKIVKIADELGVNTDVIRHIIETDYEPYQVTRYNKVQDTDGHGWRLFSQLTDDNDVDFTYYNGLVRAAYDNIASVGDPNIIFAGTKWENVKPYV